MNIDEIFTEKNIGLPVKVWAGIGEGGKSVYYYGRYYGRGYDGESTKDDDGNLLTVVIPGSSIIPAKCFHIDVIETDEDQKILEYYENDVETPYELFLSKNEDGTYYKNYLYKSTPITFKHNTKKWFKDNGYFDIDANLFGKTLALIARNKTGINYEYQVKEAVYEEPEYLFSRTYVNHRMCVKMLRPKDSPSFVKFKNPGEFSSYYRYSNEYQIILYCGLSDYEDTISLGHLNEKNEFIPYNFMPLGVINNNENDYGFIEDFIKTIMEYKLENRKPELKEEDMIAILRRLGIKKEEQVQDLIAVLNNVKNKAIESLISNTRVDKALKCKRIK